MAVEGLAFGDIGGDVDLFEALGVAERLHLHLPVEHGELGACGPASPGSGRTAAGRQRLRKPSSEPSRVTIAGISSSE